MVGDSNPNDTGPNGSIDISASQHIIDEWRQEAEEAGMTYSLWARQHIEAGRRQIAALSPRATSDEQDSDLESDILEQISKEEGATTDEITQAVTDPIEDEIAEHLKRLDSEGVIGFDPVEGGYVRE